MDATVTYRMFYVISHIPKYVRDNDSSWAAIALVLTAILGFFILPLIPACWILWNSKKDRDHNHWVLVVYTGSRHLGHENTPSR